MKTPIQVVAVWAAGSTLLGGAILSLMIYGAAASGVAIALSGTLILFSLVSIFCHQDYFGRNRARFQEIQNRFGSQYEFSFILCGQLSIQARNTSEPSAPDAIEIAKVLWIDSGKFRDNIIQITIPVIGADGNRRFFLMRGKQDDGRNYILAVKNRGSWWGMPKLEAVAGFPLPN